MSSELIPQLQNSPPLTPDLEPWPDALVTASCEEHSTVLTVAQAPAIRGRALCGVEDEFGGRRVSGIGRQDTLNSTYCENLSLVSFGFSV